MTTDVDVREVGKSEDTRETFFALPCGNRIAISTTLLRSDTKADAMKSLQRMATHHMHFHDRDDPAYAGPVCDPSWAFRSTKEITEYLYAAPDAQVWAHEFMVLWGKRLEEVDEGLMIGWFANAFATQEARDHKDKTAISLARILNDERPFRWHVSEDEALTIETAVYQAIGAASNCWERDGGQGVFQDDFAREIAENLLGFVHVWAGRPLPPDPRDQATPAEQVAT